MSLPLYMDHHVRSAVTKGLRRRGLDVLTAFEDGHAATSDDQLLVRSTELGRVMFTQDDDFLVVSEAWLRDGRPFAGLVYAHQLHATVGQLISDLQLIVEAATPNEMKNTVLFLPL